MVAKNAAAAKKAEEEQQEMFDSPTVASPQSSEVLASLSAYAWAFDTDRETLRRCLLESSVKHVTERSGRGLYSLRDVFRAWTSVAADVAEGDPDKLSEATLRRAFKRRAWWQGEREKLHYQREKKQLVDATDVERVFARLMQIFVRGLETLGDVLERDSGLTPQQADRVEAHINQVREDLYKAAVADEDEDEQPQTTVEASTPATREPPPSTKSPPTASSAVEDAVAFLRRELAGGARATSDLIGAARKLAISEATLRRAKAQMKKEIEAKRRGRGWAWQLAPRAKR